MSTKSHPYLKNKQVKIVPTPAMNRWNGMVTDETKNAMRNNPFLFPSSIKGYPLPADKYGVKPILDNQIKNPCPDVINEKGEPVELTEQEYFEKRLGLKLDPYSKDSCWVNVRITNAAGNTMGFKPTYIYFPEGGELELDLNNPADMLTYKVALERIDKIAPSKEAFMYEKRDTQLFMIEDAKANDEKVVETILAKAEASVKFQTIVGSREDIYKYYACKGIMLSDRLSDNEVKTKIALDYESDPIAFLKVANDKDADIKYTILKATVKKIIEHSPKTNMYRYEGFAGKLEDLIDYLRNPKNSNKFLEIEMALENN